VGTAAVLLLPGVLVARLLRMRLAVLATWAAVPVFSLAIHVHVFRINQVDAESKKVGTQDAR
jgi:hypothetical protein